MSYETDMRYLLSEIESLKRRLQFQERLGTGLGAGWNGVSGWTWNSANTINVPSGAASIYQVGDQLRYKQGGAYKYASVVTVADTLLTVTGGSDFSVADAAITDAAFSKGGGVGHPEIFAYTPTITYTGGTTDPTSQTATFKFKLDGRTLHIWGYGYLTRGEGDRSSTIFTMPLSISLATAPAVTVQYATMRFDITRVTSTRIYVYHSTMNINGEYWLQVTAFI